MPEGPEVKIASDYLNNHFESNKKINFEIITDYYKNKYLDVFTVIKNYLNVFTQSYTIGKNIFIDLDKNKIFNFHLGMTGGWSKEKKNIVIFVFTMINKNFFSLTQENLEK